MYDMVSPQIKIETAMWGRWGACSKLLLQLWQDVVYPCVVPRHCAINMFVQQITAGGQIDLILTGAVHVFLDLHCE